MLTEECVSCGVDVPLSAAVHMLVNPKEDEDVADGYLCRSCYEEHLEPILPAEAADFVEEPEEMEDPGDDADVSGAGDTQAGDRGVPDDEGVAGDGDSDDVRPEEA